MTIIFSCDTELPNIAGNIRRKTRLTPSCELALGRGNMRMRYRNGNWNTSWTTPARNTPHASACAGSEKYGAPQTAVAIRTRFNNTGVNAAAAKRE